MLKRKKRRSGAGQAMDGDGWRIEQEVAFESEDPAFSGIMFMTWLFRPRGTGTQVTIRAENVPAGIRKEGNQVGLISSLDNLAAFVETAKTTGTTEAMSSHQIRPPESRGVAQ